MEKVSNLLGKPIISIYDGTLEGYTKNILANKKLNKIVWLCVFDDDSQEEKLVNVKDIYSKSFDAIMIKNNENVFLQNTLDFEEINPIGYKVFDTDGNCLGKVNDLAVNNGYEIENLVLQNDELLNIKDIVNIGKNLIIKNGKKTVKIASLKPKSKILPSTLNTNIKVSIQENSKAKTVATMPKKMIVGSEFLIGRKVGQNIYSDNKQLIIKKQSKITNQIVDIASKNGKLKELTTFSVI